MIGIVIPGLQFAVSAQDQLRKPEPAMEEFWAKFQAAVGRGDKTNVAAMTGFPLGMPFGVRAIKSRAQLLKSYHKIFDAETKKCFATAKPQPEEEKRKKFSISCGEAMMYWFELRGSDYKFVAVDNVNE
jgi:hypothetical protein